MVPLPAPRCGRRLEVSNGWYRDQHARLLLQALRLRSVMLFSLLSGLSPPVQYHITHRPFHFPCASDLACGSPPEPRATFTVSVCGTLWLRMSKTTCVFPRQCPRGLHRDISSLLWTNAWSRSQLHQQACEFSSCWFLDDCDVCTHYFHLHGLWIPWESHAHVRPVVAPDEVHQVTHFDQVMQTMTSSTVAQSDQLCSPIKATIVVCQGLRVGIHVPPDVPLMEFSE